ncbi:MAG: ABC transporter ATP-binding protein [Chthoniobacterales bacterium]
MSTVIKIENLSKRYRLGVINRRMLYDDMQRAWAKLTKREHLATKLGQDGQPLVEKRGDILWALRDINLDIQDGDILGIIGRNGSGKSTLLKILSRITAPTTGSAIIRGRVASLLEVGTGFHDELTGRENVFLNGSILGMRDREIRQRFDEIVEFSGVEKFIDTPVKRYSSGMRVRLAFAVAAHLDPDILIVDEVLAVGDAAFQSKSLNKISSVSRDGRTVLFVSHQSSAVEHLCTKGVVLESGNLVFQGTQMEALDHYVQSIQTKKVPLSERTDRRGTGSLRIQEIEAYRDREKSSGVLSSGSNCDIVLHFKQFQERVYHSLKVEFCITSLYDAPIFSHHNRLNGTEFATLPKEGSFVCSIPRLPLPQGTYRLKYAIRANMDYEMVDAVDGAAEIHVEGGQFFPTGENLRTHQGVSLVDAQWHLE